MDHGQTGRVPRLRRHDGPGEALARRQDSRARPADLEANEADHEGAGTRPGRVLASPGKVGPADIQAHADATKPLFPRRVVPENDQPPYTRWLIPQLDKITGEQMLELVRILDKAMNNTSVILLFEIAGRAFLFPG